MSSQAATSSPAWVIPGYIEVSNNHLIINNTDAISLVREYNSPLFVFSEPRIRANIDRLKQAV